MNPDPEFFGGLFFKTRRLNRKPSFLALAVKPKKAAFPAPLLADATPNNMSDFEDDIDCELVW